MRPLSAALGLALALFSAAPSFAAERSVTLKADGMTCPSCPYIVKKALSGVAGVSGVRVSFKERKALVTYDDGKTDVALLTAATASVGFPSKVIE